MRDLKVINSGSGESLWTYILLLNRALHRSSESCTAVNNYFGRIVRVPRWWSIYVDEYYRIIPTSTFVAIFLPTCIAFRSVSLSCLLWFSIFNTKIILTNYLIITLSFCIENSQEGMLIFVHWYRNASFGRQPYSKHVYSVNSVFTRLITSWLWKKIEIKSSEGFTLTI